MFRKKKKLASHVKYFWGYWPGNMCVFKCITVLLSENPLAVNVLTSPKNSWNLQKSFLILHFLHSERKWVRKSFFSIRCEILGRLVYMLIVNCEYGRCNGENLRLPIEIQLSNKPQSFCYLFFAFWYLYEISNVLKKKKKKKRMSVIIQVFLKLLTRKYGLI